MKNQEVVDKWVAALRSGDYKQGKGYLCRNDEYCCLGVLSAILGVEKSLPDDDGVCTMDNGRTGLSLPVTDYVGLTGRFGKFEDAVIVGLEEKVWCLADLNDRGWTFHQIADFIESNPKGLFHEYHSESSTESS